MGELVTLPPRACDTPDDTAPVPPTAEEREDVTRLLAVAEPLVDEIHTLQGLLLFLVVMALVPLAILAVPQLHIGTLVMGRGTLAHVCLAGVGGFGILATWVSWTIARTVTAFLTGIRNGSIGRDS